jgi:hypothetical protein
VVTSLVAETAQAVATAGPARLVFVDSHGADDAADQVGPTVASRAWRFGIDLAEVSRRAHAVSVMGYSRDLARFRLDIDAYLPFAHPDSPLSAMLRAMPPDCLGAEDLRPKLEHLAQRGVDWVDWYVYSLMRLEGLDWIRQAWPDVQGPATA